MATPGRDNGLPAQAYEPLADLDPRVADAMLELLRDSGIAAYAKPAGSEFSSHFGRQLPNRPTDRLYVATGATEPAWRLLRSHLPDTDVERGAPVGDLSPGVRDDDQAWRDIVARYDSEPTGPVPPWPASEDLGENEQAGVGGTADVPSTSTERAPRAPEPEGEDEHYVPPPPPSLPRPDPVAASAWVALFGGPGYLLAATMLGVGIPGWAAFVAVAAFIGGFVTLVVRMGDERPPDSDSDDGAVV